MSYELDFECPCIEALYTLPGGVEIVQAAIKRNDLHFGSEIQEILKSLGYDSIIAEYEDGSKELIAFDRSQISTSPRIDRKSKVSGMSIK